MSAANWGIAGEGGATYLFVGAETSTKFSKAQSLKGYQNGWFFKMARSFLNIFKLGILVPVGLSETGRIRFRRAQRVLSSETVLSKQYSARFPIGHPFGCLFSFLVPVWVPLINLDDGGALV